MVADVGSYDNLLQSPSVLVYGDWRCEIVPALGGAISRLDFGGCEILRGTAVGADGPFNLASFPLIPYANRIADGQVKHGAVRVRLPPNLTGQAHPLHGVGFLSHWSVVEQTVGGLVLGMAHVAGPFWPWSFTAQQRFRLDDDGLLCTLSLTNSDATPMPVGLGFHPYFPRASTARLTTRLSGVWLRSDGGLPTAHQDAPLHDWSGGDRVQHDALIDHCHTGWNGMARIDWTDCELTVSVTASPELNRLHIYAPPGRDFFCLEPATHRPDAINADDPEREGLRIVAPGETVSGWMRINAGSPLRTEAV